MYKLEKLLQEICEQPTALFMGAGAPRCDLIHDHQLPDGDALKLKLYEKNYKISGSLPLLEEYEKKFRKQFNIKGDDYIPPEIVWGKCFIKHGEQLTPYLKSLEDIFCKGIYIPPNYKFVAWLHLMGGDILNQVVTTNFDEKIEDAYRLLQQRGLFTNTTVLTAVDDTDFSEFSKKAMRETAVIYKLHGTISRPFTIRASEEDMKKELTTAKRKVLENIFESNTLVVFVGYACRDTDIFEVLKQISKKDHNVKIVWIKRDIENIKGNIYEILEAFNSTGNVLQCTSYNFFKKLFDKYVDRETIDMSLIKQHTDFMTNTVIEDTKDLVRTEKKEPIPDVLYGEIEFPESSREAVFGILNSFDMQRLRDIKQLSFAQYRYPSATHTRFSHSLGVAHLVSTALNNQHLKDVVCSEDKKDTICAALLHDVGHGPLGHVIDKFYDRLQIENEHEEFTKKFIDGDLLIDLQETLKNIPISRNKVKNRVVFKIRNNRELHKYADTIYLAWLITDYALDLDRIDFLMRDLLMTSYKYQSKLPTEKKLSTEIDGTQQKRSCKDVLNDIIEDFVNRLCVGNAKELDEESKAKFIKDVRTVGELDEASTAQFIEGAKILCLDDCKGTYKFELDELLTFLLGIYAEMYINVYYQDRISCAEAMVAKALHIAYDEVDINRSSLYTFTDSELYAYLENLESDMVREIVYSVKHRRLFMPVVQFDLDIPEDVSAVEIERQIAKKFDLDQNDFKSLIIVHIPRKKQLENLFIKKEDKIVTYPGISQFEEQLSDIKGKIFIHPKNKVYSKDKEKLMALLENMGIHAEDISTRKWF